jgi:hypothetical protein
MSPQRLKPGSQDRCGREGCDRKPEPRHLLDGRNKPITWYVCDPCWQKYGPIDRKRGG